MGVLIGLIEKHAAGDLVCASWVVRRSKQLLRTWELVTKIAYLSLLFALQNRSSYSVAKTRCCGAQQKGGKRSIGESLSKESTLSIRAILPCRGLPLDDEYHSRKDQAQQSNGFLFHLMTLFCNPDFLPPSHPHPMRFEFSLTETPI